jgi:hypothetical protein
MTTKFLCLANSSKYGERFIAGIELTKDQNGTDYKFVLNDKKQPKWIRPVSKVTDPQKTTHWTDQIKLFDIVEIEVHERCPNGCRTEDVIIKPNSVKVIKNMPLSPQMLKKIIDHRPRSLFGNKGRSIASLNSQSLKHSLTLIKAQNPQFYSPSPRRSKNLRLKFYYNNHLYDLPVTDKTITENYFYYRPIETDPNNTYLTISLDNKLNSNRHYKIVAGILNTEIQ